MSSITINAPVIALVRSALLGALAERADTLSATLWFPDRETSPRTQAAYARLRAVGSLLDRLGWVEQEPAQPVTISTRTEMRVILDALAAELEIEGGNSESARDVGEQDVEQESESRCTRLYDALTGLEAAARTAGLLDLQEAQDERR